MSNTITSRQNLPANLRRLAAQRHLYSRAKRLALYQLLLVSLVPIGAALAVTTWPEARIWAALAGIVAAILDVGWLDPAQRRYRERAAQVQEEFDCDVLALPWNGLLAGNRPDAEDVHEAAQAYVPSNDAPLENWYPMAISQLPNPHGRLICQRTNCWWDSKLRRRYSSFILAGLALLALFVTFIGVLVGMPLEGWILAIVVPLLPAALWGLRERQRQMDAATALDRLKECGQGIWQQVLRGEIVEGDMSGLSRQLQDAILFRRRSNPFTLDWLYRRLRNEHEEQMNIGAVAMVEEAENAGLGKVSPASDDAV